MVSEPELKSIGARGVLKRGGNSVQVIIAEADIIADEMRAAIGSGAAGAASTATAAAAQPSRARPPARSIRSRRAGSRCSAVRPTSCRSTRSRPRACGWSCAIRRRSIAIVSVRSTSRVSLDTFHIVCGNAAARYAEQLGARLPPSAAGGRTTGLTLMR